MGRFRPRAETESTDRKRHFRGAVSWLQVHDWCAQNKAPRGPEEGRVAVCEDASVGCHEVVPATGGGGPDRHDRLVELDAARRPEEPGATKGEDAAIGPHEP